MNKMVVFTITYPKKPDVFIKGLIDSDYLFDEEAQKYAEGIIQYYQGEKLRWQFPVNPFMKHSIKWNSYEELKQTLSSMEKDFALHVFEGDKNQKTCTYRDFEIEREVITW